MSAQKKPKYHSDYVSDSVFDGIRNISAASVARLRARYRDYCARLLKDQPADTAPDKPKQPSQSDRSD
jgi:hypothetical protein